MKSWYKIIFLSLFITSCSKLVDIGPPVDSVSSENVYKDYGTAISALTGLYVNLVSGFTGNNVNNISFRAGLSSDELTLFSGVTNASLLAYYKNKLVSNVTGSIGADTWTRFYFIIFSCNAAIEGISASIGLPEFVKKQLLGEAFFLRAFSYSYLVSLYGDVPLVLVTDPKVTASLPRSKIDDVFKQVVSDLKHAQELLASRYVDGSMVAYPNASLERIRPNKWAATALLARVYLYSKDYENAEIEASKVISETALYDTVPLNQVFLKNSKEAIWQLQPVRAGRNTEDAFLFIIPVNGPNATANPVSLSKSLMNSFEMGDKRAVVGNWINRRAVGVNSYDYSYKYKATTGDVKEYSVVLRLAEQYFIRSEARAQLNKLHGKNGAEGDLNIIRHRAGLPSIVVDTKEKMLSDILKERRVELFLEWGHRWIDIKRSADLDAVMKLSSIEKGSEWESYQKLYPLPFNDLQRSSVLTQNEGYTQ